MVDGEEVDHASLQTFTVDMTQHFHDHCCAGEANNWPLISQCNYKCCDANVNNETELMVATEIDYARM